MIKKNIYLIILLFAISLQGKAQDNQNTQINSNAYEIANTRMQWFRSSNISGFGLDSIYQLTTLELAYSMQQGDLHRVQEAGKKNTIGFVAERFMPIGNYYLYGKFDFEQNRDHDKSWADVIDPYNSGPMIFGSGIKARYDWQSFGLSVKLGSQKQSRFMHGISVDYRVGELSRQRDPRTLTEFVDYKVRPAVSYQVANNTRLGMNLTYQFKKESLQNFKTIQENPLINYYIFKGLENYTLVMGQSAYSQFSRYFLNNYWGADLQIQQKFRNDSKLLISGGFTKMNQAVEGGMVRENSGNYDQNIFRGSADLLVNAQRGIHHLSISGEYINSGSDENVQEYTVTTDTETGEVTKKWITLYTYKNRFASDDINIKAEYTYHRLKSDKANEYRWMIGGGSEYISFDKEYRLPYSSMAASRIYSHVKGAYNFDLKNGRSLNFLLKLTYAPSIDTKMKDVKDNTYTQSVLNPDFEKYYKKDFAQAQINIRYEMPLKLKKSEMMLYIKAYAKNTMSIQSERDNLSFMGLSLGVFTK